MQCILYKVGAYSMKTYQIISKPFISNCLIEALKSKIKHPVKTKIYYYLINEQNRWHFHVMWSNGVIDYDFSDIADNIGKSLLYLGNIRKFNLGFAYKYYKRKNKKGTKHEQKING